MRVRLLVGFAGATVLVPGDEAEFANAEAVRLIEAGFAVPIAAPIETAVKKSPVEKRKRK
jgi:hypothetical protein